MRGLIRRTGVQENLLKRRYIYEVIVKVDSTEEGRRVKDRKPSEERDSRCRTSLRVRHVIVVRWVTGVVGTETQLNLLPQLAGVTSVGIEV